LVFLFFSGTFFILISINTSFSSLPAGQSFHQDAALVVIVFFLT